VYALIMPFWTDTDAYTARDRDMFAAGVEFQTVYQRLTESDEPAVAMIHRENESRIRMMCGRLGRRCTMTPQAGDTWTLLEVEASK
jgi:hypothetical protein